MSRLVLYHQTQAEVISRMIARALDAETPAAWVVGDEAYATDPGRRADLENRGMGYVLAVACSHHVSISVGKRRADPPRRRPARQRGSPAPQAPAPTLRGGGRSWWQQDLRGPVPVER